MGPQRGRVPGRTRHVPRRRPVRVGPGGTGRGGGRAARPAGGPEGQGRPGDRRRRGPVRALAGRPGGPPGRPGPLAPPAPARAAHRRIVPAGVRGRGRAALRGRLLRPGVLGVRRAAVRRGSAPGAARGAAGAAAGRAVRLLGDPPDPLGVPGRAGPRGPVGVRLLLRPHALRGAGRGGPGGLRGAPQDARRPGAGHRGLGAAPGGSGRAGVAGLEQLRVGRLVPAAGRPDPGYGHLRVRAGLTGPGRPPGVRAPSAAVRHWGA
ncbi:SAM-dependent methyltransferase [Streptomyces misionensis JCM 4497]